MPNILILSPFFYPELISTGKYNASLAKGLKAAGANVTVACSHPLYPEWEPAIAQDELAGITTLRGGGWVRYPRHPILRRAVLELWYVMHAGLCAVRMRRSLDAVVAVFPPNLFFLAVTVLLGRKVRRVGIVHDLQGIHAQTRRSRVARLILGAIVAVERATFARCDRLLALSGDMANQISEIYGVSNTAIRVCYPFVNLPQRRATSTRLALLFPPGVTHVVYSGAIGDKQNPPGLMAIFEKITAAFPDIHVHVFSEGPFFAKMKERMEQRQIRNLSFRGFVAEEDLCELYERSDVQLVPQAPGTEHGSMPSKLPNILFSGKAVLAICDSRSELARMVNRFQAGECVDSWHPDAVGAALARLLERGTETVAATRDRAEIHRLFSIGAVVSAVLGHE